MTDFVSFARGHGVLIRDLIPDGRVHRCATAEHPRSKNGAYKFTGSWGWIQAWDVHIDPIIFRPDGISEEVVRRDMSAMVAAERRRREKAAHEAAEIVKRCLFGNHPYLDKKGFPGEQGLVDLDGRLVVPMRDCVQYSRINSVQWIDSAGEKKFLPGGAAKGSVFRLGVGAEQWLCEGLATALSVRAAAASLYKKVVVVVCFSAGNLAYVATKLAGRRFVVADNDRSATGAKSAESTGLPWLMPPTVGYDANDWHQADGVRPLAEAMRALVDSA